MTGQELIVFVCQHGSAKSLIAMEYFNHYAAERGAPQRALSAGTEPDETVPLEVVSGLAEDGFDVAGRTPLRATAELLAHAVDIVSFGPDLRGLAPAEVPVRRWDDMPAVSDDYAVARNAIRTRVSALLPEAPPHRPEMAELRGAGA